MSSPSGVTVTGAMHPRYGEVLTEQALDFLAILHREFAVRRVELLKARAARQATFDAGGDLDFLPETSAIRDDPDWRVAEAAPGLIDRRVEITGPTERKMAVNALNSGAKVWLADLEDANTPLWENVIEGQLNLRDALNRTIDFETGGKTYALRPDAELATIVVRPRGWHLEEKHLLIDGQRASGSLVDFGLYLFGCAHQQLERGHGPYFYLPKLESHLEARLWNDVFVRAQELLGIARGTIRATVLIETIPAAFEMEEILYELREHSAGLNAGRWDYLFSMIKKFRSRGTRYLLPERNAVTMTAPFMRAYTELLVRTCHKRGAHAIGGMAAFIPSRRDADVNAKAMEKVRDDKARESGDGFDGSWVAHPDLVAVCGEEFDAVLKDKANQLDRSREDVTVTAADLLNVDTDPRQLTREGLRNDVTVALRYLTAWLGGSGAVAIFNLMEDAATAEISRSQVWQWVHNRITLDDGTTVDRRLVETIIDEEVAAIAAQPGVEADRLNEASALFRKVALDDEYIEFLTVPAYEEMP